MRHLQVVVIVLVSALIELLTGNLRLSQIPPPMLLLLLASYGPGALLARELTLRWSGGAATLYLLGLAYGIVNEGFTSGGFFDPHFYSVREFGMEGFGRWADINVVWALGIILVHAAWSVFVPVAVTDALFPANAGRTLLGKTGLRVAGALLAISVVLARVLAPLFQRPSLEPRAVAIVVVVLALLVIAARGIGRRGRAPSLRKESVVRLVGVGVLAMGGWIFVYQALKNFIRAPSLIAAALLLLMTLYGWFLHAKPSLSLRGRLALATGCEVPLLFSAASSGASGAAIVMLVLILLAWWRVGSA